MTGQASYGEICRRAGRGKEKVGFSLALEEMGESFEGDAHWREELEAAAASHWLQVVIRALLLGAGREHPFSYKQGIKSHR